MYWLNFKGMGGKSTLLNRVCHSPMDRRIFYTALFTGDSNDTILTKYHRNYSNSGYFRRNQFNKWYECASKEGSVKKISIVDVIIAASTSAFSYKDGGVYKIFDATSDIDVTLTYYQTTVCNVVIIFGVIENQGGDYLCKASYFCRSQLCNLLADESVRMCRAGHDAIALEGFCSVPVMWENREARQIGEVEIYDSAASTLRAYIAKQRKNLPDVLQSVVSPTDFARCVISIISLASRDGLSQVADDVLHDCISWINEHLTGDKPDVVLLRKINNGQAGENVDQRYALEVMQLLIEMMNSKKTSSPTICAFESRGVSQRIHCSPLDLILQVHPSGLLWIDSLLIIVNGDFSGGVLKTGGISSTFLQLLSKDLYGNSIGFYAPESTRDGFEYRDLTAYLSGSIMLDTKRARIKDGLLSRDVLSLPLKVTSRYSGRVVLHTLATYAYLDDKRYLIVLDPPSPTNKRYCAVYQCVDTDSDDVLDDPVFCAFCEESDFTNRGIRQIQIKRGDFGISNDDVVEEELTEVFLEGLEKILKQKEAL